jgi:hypothetical protein
MQRAQRDGDPNTVRRKITVSADMSPIGDNSYMLSLAKGQARGTPQLDDGPLRIHSAMLRERSQPVALS